MNSNTIALSLSSGAGGLDIGAHLAGIPVVVCCKQDADRKRLALFRKPNDNRIAGTDVEAATMALEYLTSLEAAKKWNISARRIVVLCAENRIEGAVKKGGIWLIPENASKPSDKRRKG